MNKNMEITLNELSIRFIQLCDKIDNIERFITEKHNQEPAPDRWFNLTELCEYLPDKPAFPTIYGKVHNKTIPHNKTGKRLRFLKSDIDIWLKNGHVKVS